MCSNGIEISSAMKGRLKKMGISKLFKVQEDAYGPIKQGRDVVIQSRTGSGKTLAFGVPLMDQLERGRGIKLMALAPTRELAKQISDQLEKISNASVACVYGGFDIGGQINRLRRGADVLVGTPGRMMDLITRRVVYFDHLEHVVLDEVDKMMDMGFKEVVEDIINIAFDSVRSKPQLIILSATLPGWVISATNSYMSHHVLVNAVDTEVRTSVSVRHVAINVENWGLVASLNHLVLGFGNGRAIIFADTKRQVNDISLDPGVAFSLGILHGDIEQARREHVLNAFKTGKLTVLLCTDVAARGIDVTDVELVIQCNPPRDADSYIHRSGRTGRAGKDGLSVCLYTYIDERLLGQIERRAGIVFESTPGMSEAVYNRVSKLKPDADGRYTQVAQRLMRSEKGEAEIAALLTNVYGDGPTNEEIVRGSNYDRRSSYKQDFSRRPRDFFNSSGGSRKFTWERGSHFSFK